MIIGKTIKYLPKINKKDILLINPDNINIIINNKE